MKSRVLFLILLHILACRSFSADLESQAIEHHQRMQSQNEGIILGSIKGEIAEFGAAGVLGTGREAINEHSLFEIGSITKTFTGVLLADQVLKGKIELTDPITDFLPESVADENSALSAVTFLELATHTSGLPRLPSNLDRGADSNDPYAHYSEGELYDDLREFQESDFEKRGTQSYSNLGTGLLGHLLELASEKPYEILLQETILTPLKMDSTFTQRNKRSIPESFRDRFATGHRSGKEVSHWHIDALCGAGAIVSSADDMLRYASAYWSPDTPPALKDAFELATENHTKSMGLGWFVSGTGFNHDGGTGGFVSSLQIDPGKQEATIRLENSSSPTIKEESRGDFSSLSGYWSGSLKTPAGELRQVLRIRDDGKVFLHSIDQSTSGIPAAQSVFEDGVLTCVFPSIGGKLKGTISGETLSGNWTQGSGIPLTFTHSAEAPEPLESGLSKTTKGDFTDLEGYWSGYLGGKAGLFVVLHIERIGKSAQATLFSPDQTDSPLPVSKVTFNGDDLKLESKLIKATYSAKRKDKTLTGTWDQGNPMPLELDWSAEKPSKD
ncbi:MAG: serine hydrolase [Verrucomicrobiales bacterium]|nr:beta-lactamase family protein [bacterium]MDF2376096.1 serine hydrolase [Verrucomicrobiales bacterium]